MNKDSSAVIEYIWIDNVNRFRDIAKQWDEALIHSGEDNPFLLSDFILGWWAHYYQGVKLKILVIYKNKEIISGLPLCQYRNGYLEYAGGINANYTEFIPYEDNLYNWGIFLDSLKEIKDWRCIHLKRFRKNKINIERLKIITSQHKDILLDIYNSDYSYSINIPEDFSVYSQYLPKKLRYYIKRAENGFSKLGKISLYSLRYREEINEACDKYINFSRNSFRRRNKRSAFEDKTYCCLFKELINRFYDIGYLDANVLKLDDRIIAIHFGYSMGNNLNYVFTAFDIDFAYLNPGHLLIYKLLELGSGRKNKLFDLYAGSHFYKQQWSDNKEELASIQIRPNCIRGKIERRIAGQIEQSLIIRNIREFLRSFPGLMDLARRIRLLVRNYV